MKNSFCAEEYKKILASSESIHTCPRVPLPKINENQNYIFISYSHKDYKYVYSDLADMYEAGVRFWYDSGLSAGKKWDQEVFEKIASPFCVGVVFYMSENLFLSRSAGREIEITYAKQCEGAEQSHNETNFFSVNLTDKLPKEILVSAIKNDKENALDMKQIGIIGQAFPDNATYVCYHSPDHEKQLIHQIKTQFGVMNDTDASEPLEIDGKACEVFIGSVEKITGAERKKLLDDLKAHLEALGRSVYVVQDVQESLVNDGLNRSLQEYSEKQNSIKFHSSKYVILVSSLLGWGQLAHLIGEPDDNAVFSKKVFYFIDTPHADAAYFQKFYSIDAESEKGQNIMQRIVFLDAYKEKFADLCR